MRASADRIQLFLMTLQQMNKERFLRTRSGAVIDLRLYMQCYYRDIVRVQNVARRYLAIGRARMELMKKKFNRVVEDQRRRAIMEGGGGGGGGGGGSA